ncbi:Nif3-like dinuclear metal center hexameric protein [Paenibacillus thermotolerans]|uniref:Nif3-like dinuclear metal center hexameric protein n=1 Tax=Paenibacillus thermotolerans TaxID=3027807 RepID=UPI002368E002|nr:MULTISPECIES: Nif3-like dinuclear metal center hexameric protein [unclassified Paenibacillus]
MTKKQWSAGQIIERLFQPAARQGATVDGIVAGSPDTVVTGIVTTFVASQYVLEQAAALGANLVITHEGIYYSHHSNTSPLTGDPVFLTKKAWVESSGMVVYRNHDHIHRSLPDRITSGLIEALEWQDDVKEQLPEASIVRIPVMELRELIAALKQKLKLPYVRFVGDLTAPCSRVGVAVGYRGVGAVAVPLFQDWELDVLIAGEGPEWETPEYVRDALHQGRKKALVLIGHAASEEPGMRRLAAQLQEGCPDIPVYFISDPQGIRIL